MKRRLFSQLFAWMLMLAGAAWVSTHMVACNTVEGVGEDVEDVGEGISGAAEGADNAN